MILFEMPYISHTPSQVKQEQESVEEDGKQLHNLPSYPSPHPQQSHSAEPADFVPNGAIFKINGGKTTVG